MISKEERADKEREVYDRGIDRKRYSQGFGHAQYGYAQDRKDRVITDILRTGEGRDVLELGSVSWKKYIDLELYAPGSLTCINISEKELQKGIRAAQKRQTEKHCRHTFRLMDAHHLAFPDHTFDIVFGTGILHHLDLETAAGEIARVLKDDGEMVFLEPLGRNPIGKLVRWLTPGARTPDERPLDKEHFRILERYFALERHYYQLFYVPAGVLSKHIFSSPYNPLMRAADRLDMWLERTGIGLYYRMIVIHGKLKEDPEKNN